MSGKNPLGLGKEPQAYEGANILLPVGGWQFVKSTGLTARNPSIADKKYPIGTLWVNTATGGTYILVNVINNVANWDNIGLGSQAATTTAFALNGGVQVTVAQNAGLVTLTLPIIANVGDQISIIGRSTNFWKIAQNAGQSISFNTVSTTVGTGGSITSTQTFNTIDIVCVVANTTWVVTNSSGAQAAYTIV